MKQDRPQRRVSPQARAGSSASAILSGKGRSARSADFTSFGWLLLFATFITVTLISFLFTPYTHQLDEIKNVLLMLFPPFLLIAAVWKMDFSAITWKQHGALILLGLYFLWMWISWLINPYKMVGEGVIWFNVGVATFTVVFAWYLNSEEKVRKTMTFFVILGLVSTFLGLFLFAGRFTKEFYINMANSPYWQTPERRPWSTLVYTFVNSNEMYSFILNSDFYAAFLIMLIPIALSMFFVEQRTIYKTIALASFLLMNVCLFLTNSNDSFISIFLVTYPLYFLVGWKYVREWGLSRRVVVTFAACTAVSLIAIAILMLPKLSSTYNFKSAAFEGRKVLWGGGFWPWIYGDNWKGQHIDPISIIFGVGPGGYRHYFPWFRRPDFFDQQINNVTTFSHNFYLDVLLETGLVGLLLFIGFVVRVFADGFRQIRTTPSRTHLFYQLAVLAGLAGIAVQNYSSPNNRWAVAGMVYWSMFGLSQGLVNVENLPVAGANQDKKIAGIPVYKICRWAAVALAAVFFLRCVAPGRQFYDYWIAATEHAEGMRAMDYATYPGQKPEDEFTFMATSMLHLENAIRHNPTFATSYYKLGHVYNRIGNMTNNPVYNEKALNTYEQLNAINPNYSEVHLNLGIMYAQKAGTLSSYKKSLQNQVAQLKKDLESAAGSQRDELQRDLDIATESLKELEGPEDEVALRIMQKAYDHFKQAAHQSLKPNTQYFTASTGHELASMYEAADQLKKALEVKEEIKKYYKSIINYKPRLADVQADQKEYYAKAQKYLLSVDEETGDITGAIEVLKQMVHDNPDNEIMLQALLAAYDKGNKPKEKLAYLEQAVHADPTDALLRRDLADAYKSAGQTDNYLRELRRVEVLKPKDVALLKTIQQAYIAAGKPAEAEKYAAKLATVGGATTSTAKATTGTATATTGTATATTSTAIKTPVTSTPTTPTASTTASLTTTPQ
jgi:tetratricopeptide (TPR) repeat protein